MALYTAYCDPAGCFNLRFPNTKDAVLASGYASFMHRWRRRSAQSRRQAVGACVSRAMAEQFVSSPLALDATTAERVCVCCLFAITC